ncbi:MAG: TlpA family protein disulfide reductase [Planctomycetes bacterium]|nr:TlpA family protein disulfide reductase [Planctomycetota bacterium]
MLIPMIIVAACAGVAGDDQTQLTAVSSGVAKKIGWYMPRQVQLGTEKPASLKKAPDDLTAPMYGTLPFANVEGGMLVVLDEPDGKPARLFIDSNGNGDLTDDAAPEWKPKPSKGRDGQDLTQYQGGASVQIGTKEAPFEAHLLMYRFDKNDPQRAQVKNSLFAYRDYARTGKITLGDKSYDIMLTDEMLSGDFRGNKAAAAEEPSGVTLFLDVNADGRFERKGEQFDAKQAFNIGGTVYELADIARDGASLKVVKSDKKVAEVPLPPDHNIGKKITPFAAKTMDGKSISFPGDYKGKVVLLDFWATWCGPCMREVPTVVAAYEKYHEKGLEILGVSLDQKNAEEKIKTVTGEKKMTWPQIYDGGYWKAEIAVKYNIESIPATFLVDGDSGNVLAVGPRGEDLAKEIEKALASKAK